MVAEQKQPEAQTSKPLTRDRPQTAPTARQIQFAQLVATGTTQTEAYRKVFNPKLKGQTAAERGCRTAALPWVAREIARVRAKSEAKKLLTVNDRLEILANGAQDPDATWTEKAACIREYGKLAGDLAPERKEISGPGGGPIPVESSQAPAQVQHLNVRARMALFKARREAQGAGLPAGRN